MKAHDGMYIDGDWRPAAGQDTIAVVNPADESVIGTVPAGTAEDVDAAVRAARAALPGWAATPPAERAAHLKALHAALDARRDEIAETVTAELGSPLKFSQAVHAAVPVAVAASYAELAATHPFEEKVGNSTVLSEPVGVVGAITPWNYPLHQIVAKAAPAFAAGCTVVLKPAEDTPLVARLFAEIVHEAGLPAGVFNLVTGLGPVAGQALAEHPGVDMVSFTGSTGVGKRIAAAKYVPGDPLDPASRLGPVVSARQRDRVTGYIERGVEEGARLVAGGPGAPEGRETGYYIRPTVFADVTPDMTIAQEEIFGPVLSILKYEDEEEAVAIANGTVYGLAGAVWSADTERAAAFARRLETGQVDINGGRFNPLAPFGGYKQSGVGRELGSHGLAEYLQTKSLQF